MFNSVIQESYASFSLGTTDIGALKVYGARKGTRVQCVPHARFVGIVNSVCYVYGVEDGERVQFVVVLANWLFDHLADRKLSGHLLYGDWSYDMSCLANIFGFSATAFVATVARALVSRGGVRTVVFYRRI